MDLAGTGWLAYHYLSSILAVALRSRLRQTRIPTVAVALRSGGANIRKQQNVFRGGSMAKCMTCGKGPLFGQSRSFSMRATKRRFDVNVQTTTITVNGQTRRIKVCSRCLRTMAKA